MSNQPLKLSKSELALHQQRQYFLPFSLPTIPRSTTLAEEGPREAGGGRQPQLQNYVSARAGTLGACAFNDAFAEPERSLLATDTLLHMAI